MKRVIRLLTAAMLCAALCVPFAAQAAEETPTLSAISFKNAVIDEKFSPHQNDYTLTLEDPAVTPTLKDYRINGDADIFVTYALDEAKHQTGILVTLEFESGTVIYSFRFQNAKVYEKNGNNLLESVSCHLGEVYPAINDNDTDYKLYLPSDLTVISLTAATKDVSAYCEMPKEITLNEEQEPTISVTVTASNAEKRTYNFKVKRLHKTADEVRTEMASPDFKSLVQGELFYQKPAFVITIASVLGGILLLAVLISLAKRLTVKVEDNDEKDFFV